MIYPIEPPAVNGKTTAEQLSQLKAYLSRLAEVLTMTLEELERRIENAP